MAVSTSSKYLGTDLSPVPHRCLLCLCKAAAIAATGHSSPFIPALQFLSERILLVIVQVIWDLCMHIPKHTDAVAIEPLAEAARCK